MSAAGYIEKVALPVAGELNEGLSSFCVRILTSQAPNRLRGHDGAPIFKELKHDGLRVSAFGYAEGRLLAFTARNKDRSIEIQVCPHDFRLVGEGLEGGYSDCSGIDWVQAVPGRESKILGHTTRLLGEMGLYSGIDLTTWYTGEK